MTSKVAFFYACGTGFWFNDVNGISIDLGFRIRWQGNLIYGTTGDSGVIPGLNGTTATWDLSTPSADPFPAMLDKELFDPVITINYPASFLGGTNLGFSMGASIDYGRDAMIAAINKLPAGTKFAIGGYSQGAAVASSCYLAGLQPGTTGPLAARRDDFLGGVMFGNPRRQINYLGDYGTWTGAWNVPGSNTGGGGAFPATGPWRRLTNCEPSKWLEFANPDDIFAANGLTGLCAGWTAAIDVFLDITQSNLLSYIFNNVVGDALAGFQAAFTDVGARQSYMVEGTGRTFGIGGAGHTTYPLLPPALANGTYDATGIVKDGITYLKSNVDTCYQLGLQWLTNKASQYIKSQSTLPTTPTSPVLAGWSTSLLPPAA